MVRVRAIWAVLRHLWPTFTRAIGLAYKLEQHPGNDSQAAAAYSIAAAALIEGSRHPVILDMVHAVLDVAEQHIALQTPSTPTNVPKA